MEVTVALLVNVISRSFQNVLTILGLLTIGNKNLLAWCLEATTCQHISESIHCQWSQWIIQSNVLMQSHDTLDAHLGIPLQYVHVF